MRLLKKINNNYALALDSQGKQIIVEGKGIGFRKMPCELTNLTEISRTYYDMEGHEANLIQSLPVEVLDISGEIYEYALQYIAAKLNQNLILTLADHIQFCLERQQKNIQIKMPIYYDVEHLYPRESQIAGYAMGLIREKLGVSLPESEKTGIALNIINSELISDCAEDVETELVEICSSVIETMMNISIDTTSYSYSRFVSHLVYLLRRANHSVAASEQSIQMYASLVQDFPEISSCVNRIEILLSQKHYYLNEEEKMYLILHVNRLCSRGGYEAEEQT